MIEVGAHIEAIKPRLGHSSIRTTSDVYGSLLPAVDAAVTDQLDALFTARRTQQLYATRADRHEPSGELQDVAERTGGYVEVTRAQGAKLAVEEPSLHRLQATRPQS